MAEGTNPRGMHAVELMLARVQLVLARVELMLSRVQLMLARVAAAASAADDGDVEGEPKSERA